MVNRIKHNSLSPAMLTKVSGLALDWLNEFSLCINERDYDQAEKLFDQETIAFGTVSNHMMGLDVLRKEQWEKQWSLNQDFKFDSPSVLIGAPHLILAVTWKCKRLDGSERSGRATIVLLPFLNKLICKHTHFSESPSH